MGHGYCVVEPQCMTKLMATPSHHVFAVAILEWLIPHIYRETGIDKAGFVLKVIPVQYLGGPYPALGASMVREGVEFRADFVEWLDQVCDGILRSVSVSDLVRAIGEGGPSWSDRAKTLLDRENW
jgi:hypothetical protein